jgi:hypothetical protein
MKEGNHFGDLDVDFGIFVARVGEKRNVYRTLMGMPEGKRQLGRPRRRWVDKRR